MPEAPIAAMLPNSSAPPAKAPPRRPLPPLTSLEEARKLAEREGDSFFLHLFHTQSWLSQLEAQASAEYAERKDRRYRVMQTSQAQRAFLHVFGPLNGGPFADLLENLYRFTEYEHPLAGLLFRALVPLSIEHESTGDFMEPRLPDPSKRPRQALALLWQSLERWCDWLDAILHLRTHAAWRLAGGGTNTEFLHAAETLPGAAPNRTLSQTLMAQTQGYWPCQELDEAVIALWPLVKRHNWTHGDLLSVLRDLLRRPQVWPCQNEEVLAAYCAGSLGLHKIGRGETSKGNRPAGYEVALRLCPPLRPPAPPGEPPWFEACGVTR
jgi:hypothetical protein